MRRAKRLTKRERKLCGWPVRLLTRDEAQRLYPRKRVDVDCGPQYVEPRGPVLANPDDAVYFDALEVPEDVVRELVPWAFSDAPAGKQTGVRVVGVDRELGVITVDRIDDGEE